VKRRAPARARRPLDPAPGAQTTFGSERAKQKGNHVVHGHHHRDAEAMSHRDGGKCTRSGRCRATSQVSSNCSRICKGRLRVATRARPGKRRPASASCWCGTAAEIPTPEPTRPRDPADVRCSGDAMHRAARGHARVEQNPHRSLPPRAAFQLPGGASGTRTSPEEISAAFEHR